MYAVINDRGKQYIAKAGERLRVDRLDVEAGASVVFDRVLLLGGEDGPRVGTPVVEGVSVEGTVLGEHKDRKVIVFKKKRRKKYRRKQGHRQRYTDIRVERIDA
jgi:large subunit ribosomal protein L21